MQCSVPPSPSIIAIPARDEAERLGACLAALAGQHDAAGRPPVPGRLAVLVLANNCTDGTAGLARALAPRLPFRLIVEEATLPPALAHAGGARRAAMDAAAAWLETQRHGAAGALLSTDADSRAEPGWLAANLAALAQGVDAVAGAIGFDPAEAALLPAALRAREADEARYAAQLDEIAALLDPEPHDPWPRHAMHSGASIALTLAAYRRIGGVPAVASGEDRALFAAVARAGLRLRHCPAARVIVSCRLEGRAMGGMAETLRRRCAEAEPLDPLLEPAGQALLRLRCRHALRRLREGRPRLGDPLRLALALGLRPATLRGIIALPRFSEAWEALQAAAWLLGRRPMPAAALAAEIRRADAMLAALRPAARRLNPASRAAGRADSAQPVAAG